MLTIIYDKYLLPVFLIWFNWCNANSNVLCLNISLHLGDCYICQLKKFYVGKKAKKAGTEEEAVH